MSELGRLLEETRTAKELSLADVESTIRVRQKYLEALEQGDYAALPPGATARGFLRNYARFLGLDSTEILRLYGAESGDTGPALPLASNGGRPIDYRPLEVTLMHENPSHWGRWVLALVLVIALAVAVWWFMNNQSKLSLGSNPNWLAAFGPRPTNTATTATTTATRSQFTVTPPAAPSGQGVPIAMAAAEGTSPAPTPTSDLLTLPIPTIQPTATRTPTPRPTATLEPSTGISLTMKTTQRAWTKVTADGEVIMQELLEAGQERGFEAAEQMVVLTGNAGGVTLTVNSQDLGTLGNVGQVVERTWVVGPDGQIAEATPDKRTPSADTAPAETPAPTTTATP